MVDIYVVDVDPGDEDGSLERIRELVTETDAPALAFMVTAVPNEQPLDSRLQDWVHRFRLLQQGVRDLPVQVGMLIQALIGHGDRNRIRGSLPFRSIVGADGTECRESFCPLDAGFQAYTDRLIRTLAETAPSFFMIDDDFRLDYHAPAHKGCMCPLHLERLGQRLGTSISREDLLSRLDAADGTMRALWEELKKDSLVELASVIRNAIDAVDAAIPGWFCCVTAEAHFAPAIVSTLAGCHQPQVRINNATYLESGHKLLPRTVTRTFYQIAQFSQETRVLTEADTCPHTRYSLSVKSHLAHITATLLAGCHGGKYWFPKTDRDAWQDTAPFLRMLAERRPFVEEVKTIAGMVTWLGPAVLGRMAEIWRKPFAQRAPLDFLSDDWGWRIFGRMGIPFTTGRDGDAAASPRAMSGTAPWAFSDDELLRVLAGPLLLDGEAAWHFSERGMGELLGVTAEPSSFPCAVEFMHVIPESRRARDTASGITGGGRYLLTPQSGETRVVSSFASGSPAAYTTVAPALTWFQNHLGGRVAVYGLSMRAPLEWVFYNSKRKTHLIETLTWLAGGAPPVVVETDLDVFALYGRDRTDDKRAYLCLFDLNPDPVEQVRIVLPGRIDRIERLALSGTWVPVRFTTEGQSIRCAADAPTMEPFILRLSR
jgi:hypothetical protein